MNESFNWKSYDNDDSDEDINQGSLRGFSSPNRNLFSPGFNGKTNLNLKSFMCPGYNLTINPLVCPIGQLTAEICDSVMGVSVDVNVWNALERLRELPYMNFWVWADVDSRLAQHMRPKGTLPITAWARAPKLDKPALYFPFGINYLGFDKRQFLLDVRSMMTELHGTVDPTTVVDGNSKKKGKIFDVTSTLAVLKANEIPTHKAFNRALKSGMDNTQFILVPTPDASTSAAESAAGGAADSVAADEPPTPRTPPFSPAYSPAFTSSSAECVSSSSTRTDEPVDALVTPSAKRQKK